MANFKQRLKSRYGQRIYNYAYLCYMVRDWNDRKYVCVSRHGIDHRHSDYAYTRRMQNIQEYVDTRAIPIERHGSNLKRVKKVSRFREMIRGHRRERASRIERGICLRLGKYIPTVVVRPHSS